MQGLIHCSTPPLWGQNSAVIMAVAAVFQVFTVLLCFVMPPDCVTVEGRNCIFAERDNCFGCKKNILNLSCQAANNSILDLARLSRQLGLRSSNLRPLRNHRESHPGLVHRMRPLWADDQATNEVMQVNQTCFHSMQKQLLLVPTSPPSIAYSSTTIMLRVFRLSIRTQSQRILSSWHYIFTSQTFQLW